MSRKTLKHEDIALEVLVQCAKRELAYRKRVYLRLVDTERMTLEKANHEIDCMARIVEILEAMDSEGKLL